MRPTLNPSSPTTNWGVVTVSPRPGLILFLECKSVLQGDDVRQKPNPKVQGQLSPSSAAINRAPAVFQAPF